MHEEMGDDLIRYSTQPHLEEAENHVEELGLPDDLTEGSWVSTANHIATMLGFVESELTEAEDGEQTAACFPFVDEAGEDKVILVWGERINQSTESRVTVRTPEILEEFVGLIRALEA